MIRWLRRRLELGLWRDSLAKNGWRRTEAFDGWELWEKADAQAVLERCPLEAEFHWPGADPAEPDVALDAESLYLLAERPLERSPA